MSRPWTAPSRAASPTIASDGERPGEMPFGQHDAQEHAEQRERRSDRQVDAAGNDDQPEAQAEDTERPNQSCGVLQVGRRQEPRVECRHDRAQHDQQQEDRDVFFIRHSCADRAIGRRADLHTTSGGSPGRTQAASRRIAPIRAAPGDVPSKTYASRPVSAGVLVRDGADRIPSRRIAENRDSAAASTAGNLGSVDTTRRAGRPCQ